MGFVLERGGFVESSQKFAEKVVYCFVGSEYFSHFTHRLYFLFFKKEKKQCPVLQSTKLKTDWI